MASVCALDGSRDLRRVYAIDPAEWKVTEDIERREFRGRRFPPMGRSVSLLVRVQTMTVTIRSFVSRYRLLDKERIAARIYRIISQLRRGNIYLSQWYKHRILKLDTKGNILRAIDAGRRFPATHLSMG